MDETITVKVPKGLKSQMIAAAKEGMFEALAGLDPPFNEDLDKVKLHGCSSARGGLEVVYRVMRGSTRSPDTTAGDREQAG